jgi:hypothetical protein
MNLLSNKPLISIDCDGVLVPNTLEQSLNIYAELSGLGYHDGSPLWAWYNELVRNNPQELNVPLLKKLIELKDQYYIELWTNRSYTVEKATMANLGVYASVFDAVHFYSGRKHLSRREGVVIDNNERYLSCGETGILYTM